jgi:hypothetical protein
MHPCQDLGRRRRDFADEAAVDLPGNETVVVSRPRSRSGSTFGLDGLPTSRTHNTRTQRHTRPALARLIGQLGDPSAQISGAPADRAVVGMPADAAAVAHREGVLPGGKKRPQFLSKLVHVVHGVSLFLVARVAPSTTRLVLNAGAAYCGISARTRSVGHAVDRRAGAQRPRRSCATRQHGRRRASIEPDVTMVVLGQHAAAPSTIARRPDRLAFDMGYRPHRRKGLVSCGTQRRPHTVEEENARPTRLLVVASRRLAGAGPDARVSSVASVCSCRSVRSRRDGSGGSGSRTVARVVGVAPARHVLGAW